MSYRIEISPNNRAGCTATHCKKEGVKIVKGTLRQGTLVTIQEHTSFRYRHWGCVTPQILHNWAESSGMDMELIDGYEDLPDDVQAKVKRALEQGHVDDEDWNGDVECNRFNPKHKNQGMFVKTPKGKAKKGDEEDEAEATPSKTKKATKKRARAGDEEDDVEPAPKKSRAKAKTAVKGDDEDDEPKPAAAKKAKKATKSKKAEPVDDDDEEPEPVPAAKKGRAKKAKSAEKVISDEDKGSAEPAPAKKTKAKKGTAKAATKDDDAEEPPKRKKRGTTAT